MSEQHTTDLRSILAAARGELTERWEHYREDFGPAPSVQYAADVIHEIADGSVPVYTSELLALACEDNGLGTEEPEIGPAFDGSPTPTNIIAANVYERITADLFEHFEEIRAAADLLERAEQEGYDAGAAAGSWLLDGNSTEADARRLLVGIEEGDPEVLDELPSAPLSGEWADGPTPAGVLASLGLDEDADEAEDVLRAFEDGYARGVQDEAVLTARALLGLGAEGREGGEES